MVGGIQLNSEFDINSTCFFTGPRPRNLPSGNYDPYQKANKRMLLALRSVIIDHIENKDIDTFITGMALGIDLWAARIVLKLKEEEKYNHIKLIGAIPVTNQSKVWEKDGREEWDKVFNQLDRYYEVHKLDDYKLSSYLGLVEEEVEDEEGNKSIVEVEKRIQPTIGEKMQKRNEWMVDHARLGISVFSGNPGGTMNCLIYASNVGKGDKITILNPYSLLVQEGIQ